MKILLSILLLLSSSTNLLSNLDSTSKEILFFYIDRKCGFECSIDTNELKSIYIPKKNYKINSKKVTKEMWLQNIISLTKLKDNPTKTYNFIVYDLDKVKFLEFYAETNYTLKNGSFKEYYTNGKIKYVGNYNIYTITLEPNDVKWNSSLKNGKWLTYKKDGTIEAEQNFIRGVKN